MPGRPANYTDDSPHDDVAPPAQQHRLALSLEQHPELAPVGHCGVRLSTVLLERGLDALELGMGPPRPCSLLRPPPHSGMEIGGCQGGARGVPVPRTHILPVDQGPAVRDVGVEVASKRLRRRGATRQGSWAALRGGEGGAACIAAACCSCCTRLRLRTIRCPGHAPRTGTLLRHSRGSC